MLSGVTPLIVSEGRRRVTKEQVITGLRRMADNERVWGNEGNALQLEQFAKALEELP